MLCDRARPNFLQGCAGWESNASCWQQATARAVAEAVTEGLGLDGVRADLTPDQKVLLVLTRAQERPGDDGRRRRQRCAGARGRRYRCRHGRARRGRLGRGGGCRAAGRSAWTACCRGSKWRNGRAGSRSKASSPGLVCRSLGMIAAAFGYLTPVQGALLQELIDVAVILNALRALRISPREATRIAIGQEAVVGPCRRLDVR